MSHTMTILLREWVLVLPVLFALVGPWLGMGLSLADRHDMSFAHGLMIAFGAGVAWAAILASVAHYAGWGLGVVALGYFSALPVSIVLMIRRLRRPKPIGATNADEGAAAHTGWQGLALASVAGLVAGLQQSPWYGTPDAFYHLAATRSLLATGRPIVTDPFFGTASRVPDASAGIWNTVQAIIARVMGVDPASAYLGFTVSVAFFVVLFFWILAFEVGRSRWSASLATLAYFGLAWYTDFRASAYPNRVGLALAFASMVMFLVLTRRQDRLLIAVAAGLTFATLAIHLAAGQLVAVTGVALLIVYSVLWVAWRRTDAASGVWNAAMAQLAALAVAGVLALPTLYPRMAAISGSSLAGQDAFVFGGEDLIRGWFGVVVQPGGFAFGGPVLFWLTFLVGVLVIVELVKHRSLGSAATLPLIGLAHTLMLFPPVSTPALSFSTYMVARIVELLRFSPYIALAWSMGVIQSRVRSWARGLGVAILVVALVTQWGYVVSTYWQGEGTPRRGSAYSVLEAQRRDVRLTWGFDAVFRMRSIFGNEYPLVIADPFAGYHLMGLEPVAVVASLPSHTPVFMDRGEVDRRSADMTRFFGEHATESQRAEILERYGDARYVFVWKKRTGRLPTAEIAAMPQLKVVFDGPAVMLFEIER